jgi:phosphoserine phosphatase
VTVERPASTEAPRTLLVTVSAEDRPGLTSGLFAALAPVGATVLDLEQQVTRGRLTLTLLLEPALGASAEVAAALEAAADRLGVTVTVESGSGDTPRRRSGRAAVVLLASRLDAAAVAAVAAAVAAHGANIDRIRRLSRYPVTTIELDISGADVTLLRTELSLIAATHGIDIAVAPGGLARRGRRLVVLDVDSTFIQQEVIELLAARAGREAQVAAVTERAMRGEFDFAASLHARVATLAGLPEAVLAEVRAEVRLTPGARTLVRTLGRLGFTVALVSGGFLEIVGPLAAEMGIRHVQANRLEVRDGRLTGRVDGDVVDRAAKAVALRRFAAAEQLPLSRTVAIGDGANDLDMLAVAGLGIAFNAKPLVRDRADTSVSVPYLDAVLFLLGITREEIEEADSEDLG